MLFYRESISQTLNGFVPSPVHAIVVIILSTIIGFLTVFRLITESFLSNAPIISIALVAVVLLALILLFLYLGSVRWLFLMYLAITTCDKLEELNMDLTKKAAAQDRELNELRAKLYNTHNPKH